ncbi:hypothetical protein [Brevibacterium sp. XM4083]|nr:hypothetical protein [Brevibacterium sp. XM4083]
MFSDLSSALEVLDRLAEPPLTTAMARSATYSSGVIGGWVVMGP